MKPLSPDQLITSILEDLCVCGFNGVKVDELWKILKFKLEKLDEFQKKLVWNWLIDERDFHVFHIVSQKKLHAGMKLDLEMLDKAQCTDLKVLCNTYGSEKLRFKVDDDRQSVYLTGVTMKNNTLGVKPYELLMHIAKARNKGITSINLIKQSGQDKRSLTSRLQVLIDRGYARKIGTVISGSRTYIITHFRYQKRQSVGSGRFEKYDMIHNIMQILETAPNGVRVVSDLLKQVHADANRLDKRRFHGIVRDLCSKGYLQEIVVVHEQTSRKFIGVKLVKKYPKSEYPQTSDGFAGPSIDDDESIESESSETRSAKATFNKIFPLQNQIYDIVRKTKGITAVEVEAKVNGRYRTRVFANALASCAFDEPKKGFPYQIIRQMCYASKQRFFRLLTLEDFTTLKKLHLSSFISSKPVPRDGDLKHSLLEYTGKEGASAFKLRCRVYAADEDNLFIFWTSYKGPILKGLVPRQNIVDTYTSDDGMVTVTIKSRKPHTIRLDKDKLNKLLEESKSENEANIVEAESSSSESSEDEAPKLMEQMYGKEGVEALKSIAVKKEEPEPKKAATVFVDNGPIFRRNKLMELINKKGYCAFSSDLCSKLSKILHVDYLIDRRTVIKDALYLEMKNKIRIVKRKVKNKRYLTLFLSNENRLSDSDVDTLFSKASHVQITKAKRTKANLSISFSKVKFFKKPDVSSWIAKQKEQTEKKSRRHRIGAVRQKYSLDLQNSKVSEEEEEEEKENSGRKRHIDDDLLAPLMRQKKRKKLAVKNHHRLSASHPGMKKKRTNIRLEDQYVMTYIRGVIISQSLSTGENIEWPKVASLFKGKYTAETLRRQWPRHRKMLGYRGLQQARKNWENVLERAIVSHRITEDDLLFYNLKKLIRLWQQEDPSFVTSKANFILYDGYDENMRNSSFKIYKKRSSADIFKDSLSLIDKEYHYANASFAYSFDDSEEKRKLEEIENPTDLEKAKVQLKALFATGSKQFSSTKARTIFPNKNNEIYSQALSQLEDEKAIAFLGEDSSIKFALTDRLLSVAECKMDPSFFRAASVFYDSIESVLSVGKGMILSKKAADGCYPGLFNMFAEEKVSLVRIDQDPPSLNAYSTKSQDRRLLESDFVINGMSPPGKNEALVSLAPPLGPPCSKIWINLNGNFNKFLWLKAVCVLIRCVVFTPGARLIALCDRMYPFLEKFEVKAVMDWLVGRNIVRSGPYGGYWIQPCWYLAFHA